MTTSAATIRKALRLPATYKITSLIDAPFRVEHAGRYGARTLYQLKSPTPGTVPAYAATVGLEPPVEITETMFKELVAIAFNINQPKP